MKLGVGIFFFKIPIGRTIFNFSCKTSGFLSWYLLFWVNFLVNFLSFFYAKLQFFARLGGLFELKKKLFFHAKLQFLRGWVLFLVPFFVIFLSFFHAKFQFFVGLGGLFL